MHTFHMYIYINISEQACSEMFMNAADIEAIFNLINRYMKLS